MIRTEWRDKPCVVIASGPSLTQEDCDRLAFHPDLKSIVINDAWMLAPWADLLYAGDVIWWHENKGARQFHGEKMLPYSEDRGSRAKTAQEFGLNMVPLKWGNGLSMDMSYIHAGYCGGFQGLNLAINFGCDPIYLLGHDCKPGKDGMHFFGDHKPPLRNRLPFDHMLKAYCHAANQIKNTVKVVNLTRETALDCFLRKTVEDIA